jgi:translocation and assembly module TamA
MGQLRLSLALLILLPALASAMQIEVVLEGVEREIYEPVRYQLSIVREASSDYLDASRVTQLHRKAPRELQRALEPFGYYNARIESELTAIALGWQARYRVEMGPPTRLRGVIIMVNGEGESDSLLQAWQGQQALREGEIFTHAPYEEAKSDLIKRLQAQGYLGWRWVSRRVVVDPQIQQADIELIVDSGPRHRFGELRLSELPLEDSLLHRYPQFEQGEPFSIEGTIALQRDLSDSNFFDQIDVRPLVDEVTDLQIPIEVDLAMKARNRYEVGLGYGTDTGPRLSSGYERRWVNRHGHRFTTEMITSPIKSSLQARYGIPLSRPQSDRLEFTADYDEETTSVGYRQTHAFGVSLGRQIGEWRRTLGLSYQTEFYDVGGITDDAWLLLPSLGLQRSRSDDRIFPRNGNRIAINFKLASEEIFSSTSFFQSHLLFKQIDSFGPIRLLSRIEMGITLSDEIEDLPLSQRFFAGGDLSLRGFAYRSLAPSDRSGRVIGGSQLLIGSIESDYFFGPTFGAALFADAGNAFNNVDLRPQVSNGMGLRWRLPFGVIRFDLAWVITRDDRPWRIHISVGPDL